MPRPPLPGERNPGRRALSAAGFTLLELLVVMALILLSASAFAVALHRSLPGARTSAAVNELVRTIREAQSRAQTTGSPVQLTLDGMGLAIAGAKPRADEIESAATSVQVPPVSMVDWANRPIQALVLFPDGSSTAATVFVRHGMHERRIRVSELTGRIIVERPSR